MTAPGAWSNTQGAVWATCALATVLAAPPREAPASARVIQVESHGVAIASWDLGDEHRVALSADGGRTWRPSEAMPYEIPLRAGRLTPGLRAPRVPAALRAPEDNRLFIVQLETKGLAELRRALRARGAELLAYLPHGAWITRMDPQEKAAVEALPFVRWVGPYEPGYKIDPDVVAEIEAAPVGAAPRRYFVSSFAPGSATKGAIAAEIRALGGTVVAAISEGYRVEAMLTLDQVAALARSTKVAWIDRWSAPETDMDLVRVQCGADEVEAIAGFSGQGVRGEVMDCGIMAAHPDHDGKILHGGPASECDHGTAAYGIVFGNGNRDGDGDAQGTGVLPSGQGYFYDYDNLTNRYQATADLVSPPMNVVFQSNSWGSARTLSYTSASQELDDIVWQSDLAIFQSQSNAGNRQSRPEAWSKNVISVGGTYHWDTPSLTDDCWCQGSSIGPAEDGRIKPDLTHWYDFIYCTDLEPGGYAAGLYTRTFSGTSASTPIVAGIGGLFFQMWAANVLGNDPAGFTVFEKRPHAMTIKALLINTADQYPFSGNFTELDRFKQGWGLPSAKNLWDRRQRIRVVDEDHVLKDLDEHVYTVVVAPGEPALKVTMAYMDRAGTTSSSIHRVNDVSLLVIDPTGAAKYHGNHGLTEGNWSLPGGDADHVDTVENVFVPTPAPGTWTIRVTADEINADVHRETPDDDQDYALVVSGVTALHYQGTPTPGTVGERSLMVGKSGADLVLTWDPDCGGGSTYSIYRGDLGGGYASAAPLPGGCMVGSTSATLPKGEGSYFFLVAPSDAGVEGSLGTTSAGVARPQPATVCLPRAAELHACAP